MYEEGRHQGGRSGSRRSLPGVDSGRFEAGTPRVIDSAPLDRLLRAWNGPDGGAGAGAGTSTGAGTGANGRAGAGANGPDGAAPSVRAPELALAEDEVDGPVHLVRLVAAMDLAARRTGGSLASVTDTAEVTRVCGGALHHLVELLHGSGLRAATEAARGIGGPSRLAVLRALRPYWQGPASLRALAGPIDDGTVTRRKGPFRS